MCPYRVSFDNKYLFIWGKEFSPYRNWSEMWVTGCSSRKPPAMSRSPQIRMARWPETDKWGGKMYYGKYSLLNDITSWRSCSGVPRDCVNRIRLFGRLGLITTQASWLAQVGSGAVIGQRTCCLMMLARESIDSPRAKNDRLHVCKDKWQLATTCTIFLIKQPR